MSERQARAERQAQRQAGTNPAQRRVDRAVWSDNKRREMRERWEAAQEVLAKRAKAALKPKRKTRSQKLAEDIELEKP